jgi:hypothetical protein
MLTEDRRCQRLKQGSLNLPKAGGVSVPGRMYVIRSIGSNRFPFAWGVCVCGSQHLAAVKNPSGKLRFKPADWGPKGRTEYGTVVCWPKRCIKHSHYSLDRVTCSLQISRMRPPRRSTWAFGQGNSIFDKHYVDMPIDFFSDRENCIGRKIYF